MVLSIKDNTGASKSELKPGDIIIEVEGHKVKDTAHLRYELFQHQAGDTIEIKYIRNKKAGEGILVIGAGKKLNNQTTIPFRNHYKKDNMIYALKRVELNKMMPNEKDNSLNEIRLLASVNHINVISYKESFYEENTNTLNLVLEYADAGDLQSKISAHKNVHKYFSEKTIWSIFIQMVQGIKVLHDKNIIHRDLKSANIFLMKNGVCKLGDLNV